MEDTDLPDLSRFVDDFLNDAREGFQAANRALLTLEQDPTQGEPLNALFRVLHTLKSSSSMLHFDSIAELAHLTEDLLDRARRGDIPLSGPIIATLLDVVDALDSMVAQRAAGTSEAEQASAPATEEIRQRIEGLLSQDLLAHQGVIVIDEVGRVYSFSPVAERLFGYTAADVVGQNVSLLMPEPHRSRHDSYLADHAATGKARLVGIGREVTGLRKDGTLITLELAVHPLRIADQRFFLGIVRAIHRFQLRTPVALTVQKNPTIRVQADLLDSLFNLVGELIITRNRIDTLVSAAAGKELKTALATMDRLVNELQSGVSVARMVPLDEILQKFPRMVRDLALAQHKEINLILQGAHIELDKAILDAVADPLLHLLRNAVDHGIETAAARPARHKPGRGTVRISARRTDHHVIIEVADDGAGIDAGAVRHLAARAGLCGDSEAQALSDKDALQLIFAPGLTTATEATDVSGRGVGLDVVKTCVQRIGGAVWFDTEVGRGTVFTVQLPLATAIIQTLMVSIADQVFAIPSQIVVETLDVKPGDVRAVGAEQLLLLRGELIPFVKLTERLGLERDGRTPDLTAVVVRHANELVGVGVDSVLDQVENIVKPFDPLAQRLKGFSGGTILGDGRVALLLDVPALL